MSEAKSQIKAVEQVQEQVPVDTPIPIENLQFVKDRLKLFVPEYNRGRPVDQLLLIDRTTHIVQKTVGC